MMQNRAEQTQCAYMRSHDDVMIGRSKWSQECANTTCKHTIVLY